MALRASAFLRGLSGLQVGAEVTRALDELDRLRGRVSAVNFLFVNASNQLGEFESGVTAAWFGTVPATVIGGVGSIVIASLWMVLFPELRKLEKLHRDHE